MAELFGEPVLKDTPVLFGEPVSDDTTVIEEDETYVDKIVDVGEGTTGTQGIQGIQGTTGQKVK